MRIWIISILALAFILFGCPEWLAGTDEPYLIRAMAYPIFHANLFHLAVNCIAIWSVFRPQKKDNLRCLAIGYTISVIVYAFSIRPMVGISNILYAILGMRTPSLSSPWWKSAPVITFFIITFAMMLIPSIAATSHMVAFAIGVAIAEVDRRLNTLDHDVNRARGR